VDSVAGVVTCHFCDGAFSLSNDLETCHDHCHFHKKKPKSIYTLLETDKAARGISPGYYECD